MRCCCSSIVSYLGCYSTDMHSLLNVFNLSPLRDYLTGFHKRKVERRKAAVAELKKKIKDEQIRVREEVSMEYNQRKGSNWLPLET